MKDKLIEYSTAKLAKEKGFNEECYFSFAKISKEYCIFKSEYSETNSEINKYEYSAPTQSLLQKWLREKYKIILIIAYQYEYDSTPYSYWIYKENNSLPINQWVNDLNTYEEALEIGLQEALKLI